jgi:uncharacterized membrane protein YkvA (DUF1232 family)
VAKKDKKMTQNLKDVGFLGELWQQIRLVFYLIKDADVPIYLKILPFAGILYTLFPIDLIADVIPVLGQLDDLTILLIGAKVFIEMAPPQVVARYMEQMNPPKSTVVEGEAADVFPEVKLIEGEIADDLTDLESESNQKKGLFRR